MLHNKYEGETLLYTCNGICDDEIDTTISLHQLPNDNLILRQSISELVLSWDELQELSEFYCEEMKKLEVKYG